MQIETIIYVYVYQRNIIIMLIIIIINNNNFSGARGRVVKALDPRSRGLGFDSRGAGHV